MKFLRFLIEILIIGTLIHLFALYIAPLLLGLLYPYLNIDFEIIIDSNCLYKIIVSICWFFYFLFNLFTLIAIFLMYHKHGDKFIYLIFFIILLIYILLW